MHSLVEDAAASQLLIDETVPLVTYQSGSAPQSIVLAPLVSLPSPVLKLV